MEGERRVKSRTPRFHATDLQATDPVRFRRALAKMPARLGKACSRFRKLTGFSAVTSVASDALDPVGPEHLSPPVHPRCVERLRGVARPPCDDQWHHHVRVARTSKRAHSHACPLGLLCSCVPICLGGRFIGLAKLVAAPGTGAADFANATTTLALTIALSCHESYASVLRDELNVLGPLPRASRRIGANPEPSGAGAHVRAAGGAGGATAISSAAIVDRALVFLHAHWSEARLSVRQVAEAVGCNGKYLSHLFPQVVGKRMRAYLVGLRVDWASREMLRTGRPVKEIAYDAGFGDPGQMTRAFRRHVGVSPGAYRRIYAGR